MRISFPPVSSFKDENIPVLKSIFDLIENWNAGRVSDDNLQDNAVIASKIADGVVGTSKLATGAVTQVKAADGVAIDASGTYTGDGSANRNITTGFRPRFVIVLRYDDSREFTSLGTAAGLLAAYSRSSSGALKAGGAGNADWQGVTTDGFLLGSSATGGDSNASGVTYSYYAVR